MQWHRSPSHIDLSSAGAGHPYLFVPPVNPGQRGECSGYSPLRVHLWHTYQSPIPGEWRPRDLAVPQGQPHRMPSHLSSVMHRPKSVQLTHTRFSYTRPSRLNLGACLSDYHPACYFNIHVCLCVLSAVRHFRDTLTAGLQ